MRLVLIFIFAMGAPLFAAIWETAHFRMLADRAGPEAIVLVDIDDTLLAPVQMLGSDAWFDYRLKYYQASGVADSVALEKTLAEWEAIRHLSQMQLLEPDISRVIADLQQRGVRIMGSTAQGLALATRTVLQLVEQQVDLSATSLCKEDRCFSVQGHTVLYRKGILFTSGKPKGESFFHFCEQIGTIPKKIVAIDDKLSHLQKFEKEAAKRGIEFIGLRYSYADARKVAFSPEIADYQLAYSTLTHLVSDEEAKEKIQNEKP